MQSNTNFQSSRDLRLRHCQAAWKSNHAEHRGKNRGISDIVIKLCIVFGERDYDDGRGAIRYTMTRKTIRNLELVLGRSPQYERLRDIYIVMDQKTNVVITVGHLD